MKFFPGLFKTRTQSAPAEDAAERERQQRGAVNTQERQRAAAARARMEQEREEAKLAEELRAESAARIAAACKQFGYWFPHAPAPESRLSGRLSWGERALENIRESWRELMRQ